MTPHRCEPPRAVADLVADDVWTCTCGQARVVVERDGRLVLVKTSVTVEHVTLEAS